MFRYMYLVSSFNDIDTDEKVLNGVMEHDRPPL